MFQNQINPEVFRIYRKIVNQFDDLDSLPDLSWYVGKNSLQSTNQLIMNYLEDVRNKSVVYDKNINKDYLRTLIQTVKNLSNYEYDFLSYSASANIKDVYLVLKEVYGNPLFNPSQKEKLRLWKHFKP